MTYEDGRQAPSDVGESAYLQFLARQIESAAQFEALMTKVQGGALMREMVRAKLLPLLRSDIRRAVEETGEGVLDGAAISTYRVPEDVDQASDGEPEL